MYYSTEFSAFKVGGNDAESFLQGQLSCDVTKDGMAAYCNQKGEVLAIFILVRIADEWLLLSQDDEVGATLNRLRMYVLRSDVTITALEDKIIVSGARTAATIFALADDVFLERCTTPSKPHPPAAPLLMRRGLVRLNRQQKGKHIAQYLNLDILNALSWTKGCYVGQEAISRMHYRGRVSKRCVILEGTNGWDENATVELLNEEGKVLRGSLLQCHGNLAAGLFSCRGVGTIATLDGETIRIQKFSNG